MTYGQDTASDMKALGSGLIFNGPRTIPCFPLCAQCLCDLPSLPQLPSQDLCRQESRFLLPALFQPHSSLVRPGHTQPLRGLPLATLLHTSLPTTLSVSASCLPPLAYLHRKHFPGLYSPCSPGLGPPEEFVWGLNLRRPTSRHSP